MSQLETLLRNIHYVVNEYRPHEVLLLPNQRQSFSQTEHDVDVPCSLVTSRRLGKTCATCCSSRSTGTEPRRTIWSSTWLLLFFPRCLLQSYS